MSGQWSRIVLLVIVPLAPAHESVRLVTIALQVGSRGPALGGCDRDHGYDAQLCALL